MENSQAYEHLIFQIGKIKDDRFWIQKPDGQMLQIDTHAKHVLERLSNHEAIAYISEDLDVDEEDILLLQEMLGIQSGVPIQLKETMPKQVTEATAAERTIFINQWIDHKWFTHGLIVAIVISLVSFLLLISSTPVGLVGGVIDQWIIVGMLMLSVIIHEVGHLLAMPRTKNISISIQWTGPIPLFSIVCNEAWKLTKYERIRINLAGFISDILICGLVCMIGLSFQHLAPWIWTFLIVHLFRMLFAICPFLPGDGYWTLVDLFNQPNLWQHALTQLKQRRLNWQSAYALSRILFQIMVWSLFAYVILLWGTALLSTPFDQAILLFIRPAPLLISLNLVYMTFSIVMVTVRKVQSFRQAERAY